MFLDAHTHSSEGNGIYNFIVGKDSILPSRPYSSGIHPWYLSDVTFEEQLNQLKTYAENPLCIAIGEAGLDKRCETPWETQTRAFKKQIELAEQLQKPLIIHCVKAHQELLPYKKTNSVPWILHGFNQKQTVGHPLLEHGFYVSFGKALLQEESNASSFIRQVPSDRIFLETDEAEFSIKEIYQAAAKRLDLPLEKLESILQANFDRVFKK